MIAKVSDVTEDREKVTERSSEPSDGPPRSERILAVRLGHGANCSSIGSVIDTLFITALAGGAIFAAIVAALGNEPVRVVNEPPAPKSPPSSGDEKERPMGAGAPRDEGRAQEDEKSPPGDEKEPP
jgi:hypothetical protein